MSVHIYKLIQQLTLTNTTNSINQLIYH